ncbi:hypothetical protein ACT3SQ_04975 [Brachybacterium sp. AOP42-C2-15]|uniref:hypothetical protein n=1 Tax=unclassified Brachybacterium TaxID=2623841 RepID=UPI003F9E7338
MDNRGSAVDGQWGRVRALPSGVRMLTVESLPRNQPEHRSTRPGGTPLPPPEDSMTWGDAGA